MGLVKKNKLHNPQIITDNIPTTITSDDIGRLWLDKTSNTLSIAVGNKTTGRPEVRELLDSSNLESIDSKYFSDIIQESAIIVPQVPGDTHYDNGYDFFSDPIFLKNTNQVYDDFYAYYYKEVEDTGSAGYLRTISTDSGVRHIRAATGSDVYTFNSTQYKLVNYSKIVLTADTKAIVSIIFDNKDELTNGYILSDDKRTILIYADPEGFFLNKTVKVKYLI